MNGLCCTTLVLVPHEVLGTIVERRAPALTVLVSFPDCPRNETTVQLHHSCSAFNNVGTHDTAMQGPDAEGFEE